MLDWNNFRLSGNKNKIFNLRMLFPDYQNLVIGLSRLLPANCCQMLYCNTFGPKIQIEKSRNVLWVPPNWSYSRYITRKRISASFVHYLNVEHTCTRKKNHSSRLSLKTQIKKLQHALNKIYQSMKLNDIETPKWSCAVKGWSTAS